MSQALVASVDPTPHLVGNVDGFQNGQLRGWAHDPERVGERLELVVYENNVPVGSGKADAHREDLEAASIGDGRHAFGITLDGSLFDGEEHVLDVVEAGTRAPLGAYTLAASAFADIELGSPVAGVVRGTVRLADPRLVVREDQLETWGRGAGDAPLARIVDAKNPRVMLVELLVDGVPTTQGACHLATGSAHPGFSLRLPPSVHDDCSHVFSTRLVGYATRSQAVVAAVPSITTDWKHLLRSAERGELSALSGVAARRYRSLQHQLDRLAAGQIDADALSGVRDAHRSLVAGPDGKRKRPRLKLATSETPRVSVVIPVHEQFALTHHCLASIVLNESEVPYEVILVDDCSSDETVDIEDAVEGLRVIRNETNLRFLRSAARGAEAARGELVMFLNNDVEVTHGWLAELVDAFERFANLGMAGSKLIYPTGRLQEAGGIVWGNGKPWNVGNGANAEHPSFNYAREADYLSGAAMMVRADAWERVGGFSEEFVPAYYEDTDLAFKVRDAGYRTMYCPTSVIVHFEGMSNGRETNAGVKRFQSVNAPKFRAKWRGAYKHNGQEGKELALRMDRGIDFRVLMIDHQFPMPDNDAGGYAALQEMRLLQELGCKVTFLPANLAHLGTYTTELQRSGVECVYAPFHRTMKEFLVERGAEFDAIYITRYGVAEEAIDTIRAHSKAKIVFNNADLHFLREMRAALAAGDDPTDGAGETRRRELDIARRVDAVLSYNDVERSIIASHNFRDDNLFHCPWVLSGERSPVGYAERRDVAFLGGFGHTPNAEAVLYFVRSVMPGLLAAKPDLVFRVYGSRVPPEIEALASDNVVIEGFVEDLSEVFDTCRVFVAPLLSGAGIKGKVLESMSRGVPAVLSPVAAEATGLVHGASTLIAEDDAAWVEHVVRLYDDEALWGRIADGCTELVDTRYGIEHGLDKLGDVLRYLELDPDRGRGPWFARETPEAG